MKRYFSFAFLILLLTVFLLPTTAQSEESHISDNADLLLSFEEAILNSRSAWLQEDQVELLFYTDNDASGQEAILDSVKTEYEGMHGVLVFATSDEISLYAFGDQNEYFTWEQTNEMARIANNRKNEFGLYSAFQSIVVNVSHLIQGVPVEEFGAYLQPAVWDNAHFLSDSETAELEEALQGVRTKHQVDVAVVTTDSLYGDTAMEAADDIYDYYFYGYGSASDGILLYINRSPREYWISTYGEGERAFTDNGMDYLKREIVPHLKNDDYAGAIRAYAAVADELLSMKEEGTVYNEKAPKTGKEVAVPVVLAIGVPAIIALVLMMGKLKKMNTVNRQMTAEHYITPGSMELISSKDIFLYSHVTRTKKPEPSSSGGSHSSSSGRSHGGGGGSY